MDALDCPGQVSYTGEDMWNQLTCFFQPHTFSAMSLQIVQKWGDFLYIKAVNIYHQENIGLVQGQSDALLWDTISVLQVMFKPLNDWNNFQFSIP